MNKKSYHHGDLKRALIETGIEMINESGEDHLSLRKLAARCGTSQAAPYAHFKNKDELLESMQEHVTDGLYKILANAVSEENSSYENMIKLGEAYILFFMEHPAYFKFLSFSSHVHFELSDTVDDKVYPPYQLFLETAEACLLDTGCSRESYMYHIVNLWATVQGIAFLATQPNVTYCGNWKDDLRRILTNGREE